MDVPRYVRPWSRPACEAALNLESRLRVVRSRHSRWVSAPLSGRGNSVHEQMLRQDANFV
jgi:hypothetical protein